MVRIRMRSDFFNNTDFKPVDIGSYRLSFLNLKSAGKEAVFDNIERDSLKINPNLEVVYNSLAVGTYRPFVTFWSEYYTILGPYIEAAVMGQQTVDEALDAAQAELAGLL